MSYTNYYEQPALKEAYERGYLDAQYQRKNYNQYERDSAEWQAYEYGFCDYFDSDDLPDDHWISE